jgi:hypothetical protein
MDKITQGFVITEGLLSHGVSEWEDAEKHYSDDWKYVDQIKAQSEFASNVIALLDDEGQEIVMTALLKSLIDTFESLTYKWDERELEEVPSIVNGIDAAKKWLEEGK